MESAEFARYALLAVVGVVTIVAVAVFSKRLGVAAPLILVVVGIAASFLPGLESFTVPPEVVLVGLLPPLLYSAAINVPIVDFRRNLNTISALSVLLVIATAFVTGALLFVIFPELNFGAAVALGAVISPTDAVAATSLGKRLGLPPRLVTILEGESLVNDATALVLLRSAIAAAATAVSFWGVVGDFASSVAIAIVVGLAIGFVTVFLRSKLHDPVLDTAISFVTPFIAFIPAEELHASGVLAVVVAGLYAGHNSAKRFGPQARISERLNWRTVQFMLENGVFLLMGLQINGIVRAVKPRVFPLESAFLVGLLMTVVIIVVRFLFVGPLLVWLRRHNEQRARSNLRFGEAIDRIRRMTIQSERLQRRRERAERIYTRRSTDLTSLREEGFGWRGGLILSWSGMRGVVTLAAAQSLPETFPYREQLILIAFTVAIATLLLQGGTLPWVIAATGIRGTDRVADRRELASLVEEMSSAGLQALDNPSIVLPGSEPFDPEVVERVRNDTRLTTEAAWERAENGNGADALAHSPHQQYRALRREVLQAERNALLDARAQGTYASRILDRAQTMLDLEETRIEQLDNPSGS
ncbi:MAG TPA: sodium:proton antiporter [Lacisediminihabitans sp.]|uniref:cation:proton antiporter n=1 Tax=Lacisediminihabitans sp. TaxID=2787631 RepID=UPI002ED7EEF2